MENSEKVIEKSWNFKLDEEYGPCFIL